MWIKTKLILMDYSFEKENYLSYFIHNDENTLIFTYMIDQYLYKTNEYIEKYKIIKFSNLYKKQDRLYLDTDDYLNKQVYLICA